MITMVEIEYLNNYNLKWGWIKKSNDSDACFDLRAAIDRFIVVYPGRTVVVPNGIRLSIPKGYEGQVRSRSGLSARENITILNSPGTIDSGYRGEIKTVLHNSGGTKVDIDPGDRISQLKIAIVPEIQLVIVASIDENTDRGQTGFGQSGKN